MHSYELNTQYKTRVHGTQLDWEIALRDEHSSRGLRALRSAGTMLADWCDKEQL